MAISAAGARLARCTRGAWGKAFSSQPGTVLPHPPPGLHVPVDGVSILASPSEFHERLVQLASTATSRVHLAALYTGSGRREAELLQALRHNVAATPGLRVQALFDHSRGLRGAVSSAAHMHRLMDAAGTSGRVSAAFFKAPALEAWPGRALPPRFREALGVQHMKAYVFDDDVLLSGANLSEDYFTNRQDRYWHFQRAPALARWVSGLLEGVARFAVPLPRAADAAGAEAGLAAGGNPLATAAGRRGLAALLRAAPRTGVAGGAVDWGRSAVVYPSLQFAPVGVRGDAATTQALLGAHLPSVPLAVTTGYFNVPPAFRAALLGRGAPTQLLTAAPVANGFTGAGGPAGAIPQAYTEFLRECLVEAAAAGAPLRAAEYARPHWTYHAKGMWLAVPAGTPVPHTAPPLAALHAAAAAGPAALSALGSPNYGVRSVERDLELQVAVVTGDAGLAAAMERERAALWAHGTAVDLEALAAPERCIEGGWSWPRGTWVHAGWRLLRPWF